MLMIALATAQLVVDTTTIFDSYVSLDRPERIVSLSNISKPINSAKHAIFFTMMLFGDAIVVSGVQPLEIPYHKRTFIILKRFIDVTSCG